MIILWIVLGLVGFLVLAFVLLWLNAIRHSVRRNIELNKQLQPAIMAVQNNDPAAEQQLLSFAADPATRLALFHKLEEIKRPELFPLQFRTPQMLAESDLVQWLMHRNELGAAPAEIQFVRPFAVEEAGKSGTCYLFRFRAPAGHWAAAKGWMAGVAGPHWDDAPPGTPGGATFSELTPFDQMSEDEHIAHLKRSRLTPGLVVPS